MDFFYFEEKNESIPHTPLGILIYPICSALDVHKRMKCTKYESKKEGKDQESIQSSTTSDPGYHWESNKLTIRHNKRETSGWPQGNNKQRRTKALQTHDRNNMNDPQKKYRLGMVSKKITGGLKPVYWRQPHPKFRCGPRHIDVWFAWKTPNLSMHQFCTGFIFNAFPSNETAKKNYQKHLSSIVQHVLNKHLIG